MPFSSHATPHRPALPHLEPRFGPTRRGLAGLLALAMLATLAIAPVAAADRSSAPARLLPALAALPTRIDLPDGFRPEGIESLGSWLFSGSLADGAIWRSSAITGKGRILVDGQTGLSAAGLHLDRLGRLWVAGATSAQIRVYSAFTGKHLATYPFPTAGFINDLDIVGNTVYATDSVNQQLLVVPLGRWGRLPAPSAATTMPLSGDIAYTTGFNANGIAKSDGWLILVQSNTGQLFRVDPQTGVAQAIDTGGYSVLNGDGLEIVGRTLYVVRNFDNLVADLTLSSDRLSASLVGEISSAELSIPTTATTTLRGLYVVNARFNVPPTPDTEYWITRLPRQP
jgi:hypothetical protein